MHPWLANYSQWIRLHRMQHENLEMNNKDACWKNITSCFKGIVYRVSPPRFQLSVRYYVFEMETFSATGFSFLWRRCKLTLCPFYINAISITTCSHFSYLFFLHKHRFRKLRSRLSAENKSKLGFVAFHWRDGPQEKKKEFLLDVCRAWYCRTAPLPTWLQGCTSAVWYLKWF